MKIIRGIVNLKNQFAQCVLTLGNFDGVHLGHQHLLMQLVKKGQALNLPTVVLLFEPQPLEFFAKSDAPSRLTSFQEKVRFIEKLGINYILAVPFTQTLASLSADNFVQEWLINKLHAEYILVGDDFQFGSQRRGDITLLRQYASSHGFTVESIPKIAFNGLRVSSTEVRHALQNSDFKQANVLLGRDYTIQGYVVHGNALARQLGFPTANVHLHRKKPALQGVYLVKVHNITTDQNYVGVANIGTRPTIDGKVAILEVNIFNFSDDIYSHYLDVLFVEKLREEVKFNSLEALTKHIAADVRVAKKLSDKYGLTT